MKDKISQKEMDNLLKALSKNEVDKETWQELHPDEKVDHPPHYTREGAMECIDEMLLLFGKEEVMTFCKLNAWKYRYRAADKNGVEDLRKSDWYLNKCKELYNENNVTVSATYPNEWMHDPIYIYNL